MRRVLLSIVMAVTAAGGLSCSTGGFLSPAVFNPAFVNLVRRDVVPLAPGEPSAFVLVRVVNDTPQPIQFVVTAERQFQTISGDDIFIERATETVDLLTIPFGSANDLGVLFDCPVTRIGLGENLNRPTSDPGLFIGATTGGVAGFGVPPNINPLDATAGNFACGDTVIFQAIETTGVPGGVTVQSFLLPASEQPTEFGGPDTFNNVRRFLEENVREDEN